jgi:hypothetical protein
VAGGAAEASPDAARGLWLRIESGGAEGRAREEGAGPRAGNAQEVTPRELGAAHGLQAGGGRVTHVGRGGLGDI